MTILNDIACNLNSINWNWITIEFNWREMRCKLVCKILKSYSDWYPVSLLKWFEFFLGGRGMDHRTPISWENKITVFITAGPLLVCLWKLVGSLRFLKFFKYPELTLLWFWFLFPFTKVGTGFGLNWFQKNERGIQNVKNRSNANWAARLPEKN
jgi:hypothetical protein